MNGAGKSTLVKLLLGLYRPSSGRITVNGVDLDTVNPGFWRDQCAVVFQNYLRYATTMHENFGVFRREELMQKQGTIVQGLRERYENVVVEDKGEVFNSDLTQALELGFMLELAECMVVCGIARKESRGAHARPYDFPDRDDENFLKHTIVTWQDGKPALDWRPVTMTKWTPKERTY